MEVLKSKAEFVTTCPPLHHLRQKADLRRKITAWKALVWAYRDECVRAASNVGPDSYGDPGLASLPMERDRVSGGLINGVLNVHEDALLIDAKLRRWFDGSARHLALIVLAAEKRTPPPQTIEIEALSCGPVYNRDGSVRELRRRDGGRHEAYLCELHYQGVPVDAARAMRADHALCLDLFRAFLDVMPGFRLSKWRITGRGA